MMADSQQQYIKKLNHRTRFTQFLVWIALFFTAVGIAAGYSNWLRIHEKAKTGLAGVAKIQKEMPKFAEKEKLESLQKQLDESLFKNTNHIDEALKELRHIQDSTQSIADTVYGQIESLTLKQTLTNSNSQHAVVIQNWSLSEAHYLLQTAIQAFELKKDKEGAIKAMKLADQLLLKRGSIGLLPIRKQISKDIALITQYKSPNFDEISNEIDTLLSLLKPKEAINNRSSSNDNDGSSLEGENIKNEEEIVQSDSLVNLVKETINKAVIVRKFDKTLQKNMNKETMDDLYSLLSIRLEALRLMLLQGHDISYHRQIGRIESLLKDYYSKDDYQPMKKHIEHLDSANLKPNMPDINTSLKLLESIAPALNKGE